MSSCPPLPWQDPRFLPALLLPFLILPFVMLSLSLTGGWASLARRYPLPPSQPVPPALLVMGYCVFRRWCGYNGCLLLSADQMGLYMRLWPVFRLWHEPVFIPWSEVREFRRETMWGRPIYRAVTAGLPDLNFAFHGRTWEALRPRVEAVRVAITES